MRWDALFEDLEAQFAAADLLAAESRIAEQSRLELAAVTLLDRLRGQEGAALRVRVRSGATFTGSLRQMGSEWLVLEIGLGAALIPLDALRAIEGVGRRAAADHSVVTTRLGLGSVFRVFGRNRTLLTIQLADNGARIDGTVDRVGKDFLEVASVPLGEQRRPRNVAGVVLIPFAGVEAVLSRS
ncbi:hypothetical protein [Arthrobacter sp. HLT1-21]